MNKYRNLPSRIPLVAAFVAALLVAPSAWAVDSGSTGADGAFNPTVNTEVALPPSGILNYTTVNIPAGVTITFKDNAANTPIYMLASGDVTIAGTIDVRGEDAAPTGTYGDGAQGDDGIPGEGGPGGFSGGRGGRDDTTQRAAIIRGGAGLGPGGGPGGLEGENGCNTYGGYYKYNGTGGAYAAAARQYYSWYGCDSSLEPQSEPYGSELLQPLVGGSGGGGGRGGTNYPGAGGGGGGGGILIASSGTLNLTGTINATGGDGGGRDGTGVGGQGAGGSGGAIRLIATNITGNGKLYAMGGCINEGGERRRRCESNGQYGYGGSEGRIRIEGDAISYSGASTPTYVRGDVSPIFIANAPSLRIASVAGQAVPAVPTGVNDITLPGTTTGPVQVTFETINVPVGNTVQLRVVPAYGTPTEVISPAITGTTAAGTAEATVTLPQGPSTLQATTTYTVVVAAENAKLMGELSRLANNERVEKVEVTVALHGGTQARLITDSGNSYELPYQSLQAIGFKG